MVTATYPIAPEVTAVQGTLLDTATVIDGISWLDGSDLWQTYNTLSFGQAALFCAPNDKDFDGSADWVSGFRFAVYGGITCKSVGLDMADQEAQVRSAFERGESIAVERALMATRFQEADGENDGRWEAADTIAGADLKPALGVALLEQEYSVRNPGISPTIHMPRSVASLLLGVDGAAMNDSVIETKLGSKVVAGMGYSSPNLGPNGSPSANLLTQWIYATGPVVVARGPVEVRQSFNQDNNDVVVMAERAYVVAVEEPVLAIQVRLDK